MTAEPASAAPGRQSPSRRWGVWLAIAVLAAVLRGLYPTADPPWRATVGVVWHDEGAWTHNARNRALWGTWRTDDWNPLYVAPVFTGLEYAAFATLGVGTWQARVVPMALGVIAVIALGCGVARIGGRRAGIAAGVLLATNYVGAMYDRAAIMEGPMAAAIVISWWAFAKAQERPAWGAVAGIAAIAAYFIKAAAVFFVGAIGLTALVAIALPGLAGNRAGDRAGNRGRAAGLWTLAGLAFAGVVALALFVGPEWSEYRFYNWQMSVTRKPSYDAQSLLNRVSWFPVLHDVLSRMWVVVALGLAAFVARALDWFRRPPAEQLLVLWVGVGVLELLLHDVGNERRFVFLIPAFTALAALAIASDRAIVPDWLPPLRGWRRLLFVPLALYAAYVVSGSLVRLAFLYDVRPAVRGGAAAGAGRGRRGLDLPPPAVRGGPAAVDAGGGGDRGRHPRRRWSGPVRPVRGRPQLQERRGVARAGPAPAAGHAGPRQAGQRAGAREPHPADLRGPAVRQLRGSPHAERCTMAVDLRGAADGLRGPGHPRRPRRLSRTPDGLDLRRGRNHVGPGSRGPRRQGPARRPGPCTVNQAP